MPGKPSKALKPEQIKRLLTLQNLRHYSLPELNERMGNPFGWRTLQRAMNGQPVWEMNYRVIVLWIDKFLPAAPDAPAVPDVKMAAAGPDR
jgi:hypothetical protein